jgi:hypothetical protein
MMAKLAVAKLTIFKAWLIPVTEEGLAGETKEKIVPNIEGNIEEDLNVSVDGTCVRDLFNGYFELKIGESNVKTLTANSFKI